MSRFQAVFYRADDGSEPVRDALIHLPLKHRVALRNQIGRLNLLSDELPHLPFPHSSQVEGELRELRCHYGSQHYRILYARSDKLLVLLHIFPKASAQVPADEIRTATRRWEDFRQRMNTRPRRPPRPVGRDAP